MPDRTTEPDRHDAFVQTMTDQMTRLARTLSTWVHAAPHPLQEIETHLVRVLHDLGNHLLAALLPLAAPAHPAPAVPCACGQTARYLRTRPATVTTLLGRITLHRAVYACPHCGAHHAPCDQQLQLAAGGLSLGLQEVLALLGATQDSFPQAITALERLTLVQVCPNSARAATEDLGALLVAHAQQQVQTAQQTHTPPPAAQPAPPRLYVSMDGVLTHTHTDGWREVKVGCVYTTRARPTRAHSTSPALHTTAPSYVAGLTSAEPFGWQLWAEASRRGLSADTEVVVLGDGAHWIWHLAATHFPQATQIVDWYHASQYLWQAAATIFGEESGARAAWVTPLRDALWDGQIAAVLAALERHRPLGGGVTEALRYYTTHRERMHYPCYRARGLHIGSGTVESACKRVVSTRLKLAGMIWNTAGAEAVAVVRAWLLSERWQEAMHLRPAPRRTYQRRPAAGTVAA